MLTELVTGELAAFFGSTTVAHEMLKFTWTTEICLSWGCSWQPFRNFGLYRMLLQDYWWAPDLLNHAYHTCIFSTCTDCWYLSKCNSTFKALGGLGWGRFKKLVYPSWNCHPWDLQEGPFYMRPQPKVHLAHVRAFSMGASVWHPHWFGADDFRFRWFSYLKWHWVFGCNLNIILCDVFGIADCVLLYFGEVIVGL